MNRVASIVEGDGEVRAFPILLRRICEWLTPEKQIQILRPIRVHRDRFLRRNNEFRRHLMLAAKQCQDQGRIIVLLDADDDCPVQLASNILERAEKIIPHRHISVILANREYEAWLIAGARSLHGQRGFTLDHKTGVEVDAENLRNAKGWIKAHMASNSYGETTDQPAFSAQVDLQEVFNRSRSFRKLCSEWESHSL